MTTYGATGGEFQGQSSRNTGGLAKRPANVTASNNTQQIGGDKCSMCGRDQVTRITVGTLFCALWGNIGHKIATCLQRKGNQADQIAQPLAYGTFPYGKSKERSQRPRIQERVYALMQQDAQGVYAVIGIISMSNAYAMCCLI